MAFNAEQLNIVLSAQTKDLRRELANAEKRIKNFEAKSKKSLGGVSLQFDALSSVAKRFAPAIAAAFSAKAFMGALDAATELENLARIAGVGVERFQVLALTAQQFGIGQEKLSDILKDVNDKFGDYVQTGAGPLADFFENIAPKVGLTAAAFANLSSEEKMGAYVNALNAANVSQAEMTFYMEAIASDSVALVAAFDENGAAIARMEAKAKELGLTIDRETIAKAKEAKGELSLMASMLDVQVTQALLSVAPLAIQAAGAIATITAEVAKFLSMGAGLAAMANKPFATKEELRAQASEMSDLRKEYTSWLEAQSGYDAATDPSQKASWERRLDAARQTLDLAIEERNAKQAAEEAAVSGIKNLKAEADALKETARLQGMTAEAAERERISKQRAAYEAAILNDITNSGRTLTEETKSQVAQLGAMWESAAVSASKVLNPQQKEVAGAKAANKIKEDWLTLASSLDTAKDAAIEYEKAQKTVNAALSAGVITKQEASTALAMIKANYDQATGAAIDFSGVASAIETGFEDAFMSLLDGTENAKDAFRSMARQIIAELYRVLVVQRLVGSFGTSSTAGSGILGALGNAFPALKGAASGSYVQAGQATVVGEHGRELFVPPVNGRILNAAQAQNMANGNGGGVTVNQNITFGSGVSRAEIQQMLPKIVETTKAAVFDAQRRSVSGMGY